MDDMAKALKTDDTLRKDLREMKERLRRIETRVTKFMEAQGFDTGVQKATWADDHTIDLPSDGVPLKTIMDMLPKDQQVEYTVTVKGRFLCTMFNYP